VNWPPAPEPAPAPAPALAPAPRLDRPRALADDLPPPPSPVPPAPMPVPSIPNLSASMRMASEPQSRPLPASDPLIGLAAELSRTKSDIAPRAEPPRVAMTPEHSSPAAPVAPPSPPPAAPAVTPAADTHLAEMAQRLETALRRPLAPTQPAPASSRPSAVSNPKRLEPKAFQFQDQPQTNGPTNGAQGNGAPARSIYEDLEQEMASLLGRQTGKT
jgi:flagellar protein FliO/FliZ